MKTLAKLGMQQEASIITQCLTDESASVSKLAAKILSVEHIHFSATDLLSVARQSKAEHTLLSCINLAKSINKWERLIFLTALFEHTYSMNNDLLNKEIVQWVLSFNRSASQPSEAQIRSVFTQVKIYKHAMTDTTYEHILFTLKLFGYNL